MAHEAAHLQRNKFRGDGVNYVAGEGDTGPTASKVCACSNALDRAGHA